MGAWQIKENKILIKKEITEKINIKKEIFEDINISFLWDVMIWGRVKNAIYKNWMDYVFSWTTDFLNKKDMVVLNLETTVTNAVSKINKTYTFKADEKHLKWLKKFNKNLYVNLANNHIWDFKEIWMLDTMKNLEKNNIWFFGLWWNIAEANSMKIVNIKNTKIWLIWQNCISPQSYKAGENEIWTAFFDKNILKKEIINARKKEVDLIILNAHCWIEYSNWPEKRQKNYYHFAIDNWVDLVIWHHPHWYQWIENYKWKIIFYSLWDYIFDIFRWRRTQEWIIADVFIKNKKIDKINIEAVHIYGFWNTKMVTKKQKNIILNELQKISNKLSDIKTIKDWYIKF